MHKWFIILCLVFTANLRAEVKVLAFSGSTRNDSSNKKLILEATQIARQMGANVTVINLKDYPMPFFDEDLETKDGIPAKAKQFRQLMSANQIIFIASPEYNSSVSGVLKNALDWASRAEAGLPSPAIKGKKFVLMSASPSPKGGARGLVHLKAIIENIGGIVIPQQIVVPDAYNAFDDKGHLKDSKLQSELQQLIQKVLSTVN